MTLSVVIPVRNDPDGLTRLLTQLSQMQIAERILVCDDASDIPCRPADLGFDEAGMGITYLRSDAHLGAGHARNMGIRALETDHVLFFDSDDLLTDDLPLLLADLTGHEFDFCIFRHIDSRQRDKGTPGPMPSDQDLWEQAGLMSDTPFLIDRSQAAQIVMISAYPWNKIYRTAFLQEAAIRCTEIPVHNDIELHWTGFLKAERIYASARLCCEHFVHKHGDRLTNQRGQERLRVFEALDPLHDVLHDTAQETVFLLPMARFYTRLFGWILTTLDSSHHQTFYHKVADFLLDQHTPTTMALIAAEDPGLARHINSLIRRGWA
ncbi:glycosyltransferase family 2 protein [Donghicola sp. XS_ASV15]|uniref:glycosyltransferase family 2 protein n=1 Tax=Donghicola sp. XS_ASV15 TaxID=3241295 RepID=UPI0035162DC5